jgi:hypothetical protein
VPLYKQKGRELWTRCTPRQLAKRCRRDIIGSRIRCEAIRLRRFSGFFDAVAPAPISEATPVPILNGFLKSGSVSARAEHGSDSRNGGRGAHANQRQGNGAPPGLGDAACDEKPDAERERRSSGDDKPE